MSLSASFSAPPSKRPRLNTSDEVTRSHKRRRLVPIAQQKIHPGTASILPEDAVRSMMEQSIGLVLKSYGFDGATQLAMEEIRQRAESYFQEVIGECMVFARAQRRSRPTIIDYVETLKRLRCTPGDCESEIDRYRAATNTTTKPSRVFEVPRPPPSPPPSPDLQKLLGPDLLPPKQQQQQGQAAQQQQQRSKDDKEPRRDYIDDFLPSLPSRHTYVATPVFMERPTDPREIREIAMEESRVGGETLRKMLASISKCSAASGTASVTDASMLKDERTIALAVGRGDSRRRRRDAAWQVAWEGLTAAKEKKKAKAAELANGLSTLEDGDSSAGDDGKPRDSDDRQWWMDGIVNSEKDFFRKGAMKRVLKTPVVLV